MHVLASHWWTGTSPWWATPLTGLVTLIIGNWIGVHNADKQREAEGTDRQHEREASRQLARQQAEAARQLAEQQHAAEAEAAKAERRDAEITAEAAVVRRVKARAFEAIASARTGLVASSISRAGGISGVVPRAMPDGALQTLIAALSDAKEYARTHADDVIDDVVGRIFTYVQEWPTLSDDNRVRSVGEINEKLDDIVWEVRLIRPPSLSAD